MPGHRPRPAPQGFTLLELVVVILIISVLFLVAVPRYMQLQREARIAAMKTLHGNIHTAAALARTRCTLDLAADAPPGPVDCRATPSRVQMQDVAVAMVHHSPTAAADGIDLAAQIVLSAEGLFVPPGGEGGALPGATRTWRAAGADSPGQCQVKYTAPSAPGSEPTVTIDTSGC